MAFRISDYVIGGELLNTRKNSTHGCLELAGADMLITFELTGDCEPDLRGRHIRFTAVPPPKKISRKEFRALKLAPMQIGPTGIITASGWYKTFECSVEEFYHRSKLGEPPPTTWKRRFYMNWFSQNGEVTIELAGAEIEYLDGEEWKPLPPSGPTPDEIEAAQDAADLPPAAGLEITLVTRDGQVRRHVIGDGEDANELFPPADPADVLQRELDAQARAVDRALRGGDPDDEAIDAAELMDDCIDHDPGILLIDIFDKERNLPDPDSLSEEKATTVIKILLMQLAMCGVAFHICEHCTMREAYRLLYEKVLKKERVFERAFGTGWVQAFMSSEYCKACGAEDEDDEDKVKEDGENREE